MKAAASNVTYKYDDKGRLSKVIYKSGEIIEYSYDKAGNRTQKVVTGTAVTSSPSLSSVVVLPISGFIVLPLGNPNCSVLSGCK